MKRAFNGTREEQREQAISLALENCLIDDEQAARLRADVEKRLQDGHVNG